MIYSPFFPRSLSFLYLWHNYPTLLSVLYLSVRQLFYILSFFMEVVIFVLLRLHRRIKLERASRENEEQYDETPQQVQEQQVCVT